MKLEAKFLVLFLHTLAKVILVVICFFFPLVVVADCNQNTPPVIFNFGDSNSDTGGFTAGLGLEFRYPYGRASSGEVSDRACDGRLLIDFFCEYLGIKYLSPYLNSINSDFKNGVNFAIVGAATLPKYEHFNLNVQIQQFKHFYNRSVLLHSQGVSNLVGKDGFKTALYTFDIGQNDLSFSFESLSYAEFIQRIPLFISEIKNAMLAIYEHGGRNFWVHNTGPLGCLPRELAMRSNIRTGDFNGSDDYDEYGCLKALNKGAKVFNTELSALFKQLRSQMKNSTIVYVDMYSIKYDLVANSSSYGFKHPLMACCGSGGQPYNYNEGTMCSENGCSVCEVGKPYISWDGTHYTEAANSIVASKILSSNYSSPHLPFNFFCNNLITSLVTRPNFFN